MSSLVVLGLGLDIVDLGRFQRVMTRQPSIATRLFTSAEQDFVDGDEIAAATAFALKEAVMKALGGGIGAIRFTDILLVDTPAPDSPEDAWGAAFNVALDGRASARAEARGVAVVAAGSSTPVPGHVCAEAVALGVENLDL